MNYPPGTQHDPDAPWNEREGKPCPDCGAIMTEQEDDYDKTVDYECVQCGHTETICYE